MTNWFTYESGRFSQDLSEDTVDLDPNKVFAIADDNSLANLKPKFIFQMPSS